MANCANSFTYADKTELPSITEQAIQGAYASEHNMLQSKVFVNYYGWYGRCIVVVCGSIGNGDSGCVTGGLVVEIDGVIIQYPENGLSIEIWKY